VPYVSTYRILERIIGPSCGIRQASERHLTTWTVRSQSRIIRLPGRKFCLQVLILGLQGLGFRLKFGNYFLQCFWEARLVASFFF
jgi:hypothetical protein